MDTSDNIQSLTTKSSIYNFNFKTIFLFVILLCACCLLSIGYNFQINKLFEPGISMFACCILVLFLFYVFYEFFKSDTCEDLNKSGWDRLKSSASRGSSYLGQQVNTGSMALGNAMNNYGQRVTNPTLNNMSGYINSRGQTYLPPQYQNIPNM